MGAKDSKQSWITYEEAVKRVTEVELKRLKEAFKRLSNLNAFISKHQFVRDVLGDGVPVPLAEYIYTACGGSPKGIVLKDLLCGLVLISRGQEDEKIKFLFGLYSNDSGTHILKDELYNHLHVCEGGFVPDSLSLLFNESSKEKVTFEEFRDWLKEYPDATSLTRWLLCEPRTFTISNELESPTFYQTLAGVTHLEERDVIELEKRYWVLKGESRSGRLDLETLRPLISPPVPLSVCEGVFAAFDENRDGHIDFKEMACGISAATKGPMVERQKFCFKVFDLDRDGLLSESEVDHMITVLVHLHMKDDGEPKSDYGSNVTDKNSVFNELMSRASTNGLSIEEYLIWSMNNPLCTDFLCLLFQVCHIVLGLKPATSQEEGEIVKGWLDREGRRGLQVGQFWYMISMEWWNSWLDYVGLPRAQDATWDDEVPVSNITMSEHPTGSLKRVAKRLYGDAKRAAIENTVALENSTVVVKGISLLDFSDQQKSLNDSLSSSPSQSPRLQRRHSPARPGPINNACLITPPMYKVSSLTGEGGKLKKTVMVRSQDFELVPDSMWKALYQWYGGSPALPRQVILPKGFQEEVELYPITLKLLRHQSPPTRQVQHPTSWTGVMAGYGTSATMSASTSFAYIPKRYLAYLATFSRMATVRQVYVFLCERLHLRPEDVRLWFYHDENNMVLIEDEESTLEELGVCDENQLLIEVRNKDLTWPEEMGSLTGASGDKAKLCVASEKGATGLNNLGNTCFMNAALQCVSNTRTLTEYFIKNYHLYELNRTNPLGMKGHIARRYGDLVNQIWSGSAKTIAPLRLRWTIAKYAPRFDGTQQHDSQELLAFLLDGLHEDLNRVHDKPYVELKDSDGRSDVHVAQEAWENHILRNKSIIVDLFHGLLKSRVQCKVCGHESVRFDPFTYLSLPLPMESLIHIHITVIKLDGSVPTKYGLCLNADDKYSNLKQYLSSLCNIPPFLIKLADLYGSQIKTTFLDDQKVKVPQGGSLYAYELPTCVLGSGSTYGDDERLSINSFKSQREAQTFQAIQRSALPRVSSNPAPQSEEQANPASLPDVEVFVGDPLVPVDNSDSGNCSASSCSLADSVDTNSAPQPGFIVAFHRKMIPQDAYFVTSQKSKPSLFGLPVIVPCCDTTTHQDLYQSVWQQVARLVSPLPPSETAPPNHAMDCDDSLGYDFPFVLKAVNRDGSTCVWCPWYMFCRGCRIQCCDTEFSFSSNYLAIDWDPTALHLRYQTAQEKVFEEHSSIQLIEQMQVEPINLDYCLKTFTKEEELGENEKYYCSKCKLHQLATKKLDIWRLPPILIVHLKRFQFLAEKWVKSEKVVQFPFTNFDPTSYLASIPRDVIHKHKALGAKREAEDVKQPEEAQPSSSGRVSDPPLLDFHQHKLEDNYIPYDLQYNLYAFVSHFGMLGGGHYVSYANNPNGKWYYYNDSSCKEVSETDTSSAYMLFYERQGICKTQYMPDISGLPIPDTSDLDEEFDSDLKKVCSIM